MWYVILYNHQLSYIYLFIQHMHQDKKNIYDWTMHFISDIQDYVLHLLKSPLTIPVIFSKKPKQPKQF